MFFSKFIVSAVALFGAATSVMASPIAEPAPVTALVEKRGGSPTDVYNTCHQVYTSCVPHIQKIPTLTVAADLEAEVDLIANIFVSAVAQLQLYVNVDVAPQLTSLVTLNVQLFTELLVAVKACVAVNASIYAKIQVFLNLYLQILAKINASLCGKIGAGLPIAIQNLIFVKLNLVVGLLGLLNIGIGISL